jgi:chromosomal replication initiation ATPase DnaA
MSVIESLHQAHKARLKRMAVRGVAQTPSQARTNLVVSFSAKRVRSRYLPDRDYERAWAFEIMGLVDALPVRRPRVVEIQRATARHFSVELNEILSDRRDRRTAMARHVAMYLARDLTLRSFQEIGLRFGGRDHSTVVHGVKRVEAKLPFDAELAADICRIRGELEGLHP